jgi:hypothetical protein
MADEPAADPPKDPPAPPAPEPTELEKLIDSMAKFDPGDIERRLSELSERIGSTDVAAAINDALQGPIGELTAAVKSLSKLVKTGSGAASPPPTSSPEPPEPKPSPDPDPPRTVRNGEGILNTLFGVPEVK